MKLAAYNPANDIPNLAGKVFLITGGTGGLGKQSVLELAKHNPRHIILTGRSAARADEVIAQAKAFGASSVTFIPCDLASLSSVKAAADRVKATMPFIDVLLANAGIMAVAPALTSDGYEVQFGTNHLGHALLIRLLLDNLRNSSEGGRIVSLTSTAFTMAPKGGIQFDTLRTDRKSVFNAPWDSYSQSKLAKLLYCRELARQYPQLTAISVHPGIVKTDLVSHLSCTNQLLVKVMTPLNGGSVSVEDGVKSQLWAATVEKQHLVNGGYYEPVGKKGREDKHSQDGALARALWDWTEKELRPFLST